eukprot:COSAG01_NODE_5151_length_4451_cov_74.855699_3_plen_94_part_00
MMAGRGVDLYALCGWVTVMGGGAGYDGLTVYTLRLADDGRTCAARECGTAPRAGPPKVAVTAAAAAFAFLLGRGSRHEGMTVYGSILRHFGVR